MQAEDYKLIDKYIQGELPEEAHTLFFQRLENEVEFNAAYRLRQQMHVYLSTQAQRPDLDKKMEELSHQYFSSKKDTNKSPKWLIGLMLAASIILLLLLWNPFKTDLYEQYAQHTPINLTEKSTTTSIASAADLSFNTKDYEAAYQHLTDYLESRPSDNKARLALGISALELGKNIEAQAIFSQIINGNSALKSSSQWYLALSYIKQEDRTNAKKVLLSIVAQNNEYSNQAKALLFQLE